MLSKADIKYIKSLQVKKYRKQEQSFLVEGAKSVQELLTSDFEVTMVVGTADFLSSMKELPETEIAEVSERELQNLGEFQTNNSVLAIAKMKSNASLEIDRDEFGLVLDDIRDPGNLGTIIRTADWYGISKIIASAETAEFYNPKVISSSMGSFTRATIFYTNLEDWLPHTPHKVYGAFLSGENIHKVTFGAGGLVVIGNESRGIRPELEQYISDKITIPRFGRAESLNAAIATAIICDNLRRM